MTDSTEATPIGRVGPPGYFVCIGAHKAGTTWLHRVLNEHPAITMSPVKEMHLFDRLYGGGQGVDKRLAALERLREYLGRLDPFALTAKQGCRVELYAHWLAMRTPRDYARYFATLAQHQPARALGEITPAYALISEEGFRAIDEQFEDAKFIFVMRNPASRVWSAARFNESRRPRGKAVENFSEFLDQPSVVGRTRYQDTLERLWRAVPRERTFPCFYEELTDSKTSQLRKLLEFLSVDPEPVMDAAFSRKDNVSPPRQFPPELRKLAVERFRDVYVSVRELLGRIPPSWAADIDA